MTIEQARTLSTGNTVTHSGIWAYRIGRAEVFTVINSDADCIRVSNPRGYVSRYPWRGCSEFVTRDFFGACRVVAREVTA